MGLREIGYNPLVVTEDGQDQMGLGGISAEKWLSERSYLNALSEKFVQLFRYHRFRRSVVKTRNSALEKLSFPESNYALSRMQSDLQLDLIHLHWVAGFLDYGEFFKNVNIPVVWTLHDMSPFSGGLHYDERIVGVDNRGQLRVEEPHSMFSDYVKRMHEYVKRSCSKVDELVIVSPSEWLAEEAKKSGSFDGRNIEVVPYGINEQVFSPRERDSFRNIMGTDEDKMVFLVVADSFKKARKGGFFLNHILRRFERQDFEVWVVGASIPKELQGDQRVRHIGFVDDEILLSAFYSASDFTLVLSVEDNFPNTVLESLMCGTPVVAFPIGGIPEMIVDGMNGILSRDVSFEALACSLEDVLNRSFVFDRERIRLDSLEKFSLSRQAVRYSKIYQRVLEEQSQ